MWFWPVFAVLFYIDAVYAIAFVAIAFPVAYIYGQWNGKRKFNRIMDGG